MLVEALTPEAVRRFMERVEVHPGSDCWLYMGDLERDRPRVTINGVKAEAYRWSWAIAMQVDPTPGMLLLHSCDLSVLNNGEAVEALIKAREAGKATYLGYSGDNEAATAAAAMDWVDVIETSVSICDQHNAKGGLPLTHLQDKAIAI